MSEIKEREGIKHAIIDDLDSNDAIFQAVHALRMYPDLIQDSEVKEAAKNALDFLIDDAFIVTVADHGGEINNTPRLDTMVELAKMLNYSKEDVMLKVEKSAEETRQQLVGKTDSEPGAILWSAGEETGERLIHRLIKKIDTML